MNSFMKFLSSPIGRIVMICFFAVVICTLLVLAVQTNVDVLIYAVAIVCGFFGWRALSKITANLFLWMSWTGWIAYFIIKGFLALAIGLVVAPFQISKMICNTISSRITT